MVTLGRSYRHQRRLTSSGLELPICCLALRCSYGRCRSPLWSVWRSSSTAWGRSFPDSFCSPETVFLLKFRTIVHDPEPRFSGQRGSHHTRLGQLLNYTRIDALLQLINVVRGDMTLIATEAVKPAGLKTSVVLND